MSVRCGSIMHYISAPERERLQKNETNHVVRPRLLLSESIVRPSCIGWSNCVKRRGVSPTARRQWMPACLSSGGRATRRNMAINTVLNRWSAPWYMRLFCAKTFDKAFKKAVMTVKAWRCGWRFKSAGMWRLTLNAKAVRPFETSDSTCPTLQCRISEGLTISLGVKRIS